MACKRAVLSSSSRFRADQEKHRFSSPDAQRPSHDRNPQAQQRPAPAPAGEKRPPWEGRALAETLWRPGGQGADVARDLGDGLGQVFPLKA